MTAGALDGIVVLDCGEAMQAPIATLALADLGAEVIKVERPGLGDVTRGLDREATAAQRTSGYFVGGNRNKRSICVDLKQPKGRDVIRRIAENVDVLVENFRPGVMDRLGLGFEELSARNQRLVYASASGFGETGPLATRPGQDLVAQSLSGFALAKDPDIEGPVLGSPPSIDYASGMALSQGILAALFERERSGLGQRVSICLFDTAVAVQSFEATAMLRSGIETNWVSVQFPNAVFETSDGWVTVLGYFRDNPLQLICKALGLEDLSGVDKFASKALQIDHRSELIALLRPHFSLLTTAECLGRLEAADILCAPVLNLRDALAHPQAAANELIFDVEVSGEEPVQTIRGPVRLSRTPTRVRRPVPRLGEHGHEVLLEFGFADDAARELEGAGVVPLPPTIGAP